MPVLTVRHVTTYRYRQPVAFNEHRMMFRPRDSYDQRLLDSALVITPAPEKRSFAEIVAAARRLDQWNMLDAARSFVDQGARLAGPAELLESGSAYVGVYTRLRQSTAAFDRLLTSSIQAQAAGDGHEMHRHGLG